MSQKELQRIKVIENAVQGRLTVGQATELLELSQRQVKRLKRAFDVSDPSWVRYGNHGRRPVNAIPDQIQLAQGKCSGFHDTHLQEKLASDEGVALSRQSVRRILRQQGIQSPQKRRPSKYRSRRQRRPQDGMLLQVDASRHDWLEGRGPALTLLGMVDDATNKVTAAHFQIEHEDVAGYLRLLRNQVESCGLPLAIYRDQHSTLQRNDKHWSLGEELDGRQLPTQVRRALDELGIEAIVARSPQAKGRVERTWNAKDTLMRAYCIEVAIDRVS